MRVRGGEGSGIELGEGPGRGGVRDRAAGRGGEVRGGRGGVRVQGEHVIAKVQRSD